MENNVMDNRGMGGDAPDNIKTAFMDEVETSREVDTCVCRHRRSEHRPRPSLSTTGVRCFCGCAAFEWAAPDTQRQPLVTPAQAVEALDFGAEDSVAIHASWGSQYRQLDGTWGDAPPPLCNDDGGVMDYGRIRLRCAKPFGHPESEGHLSVDGHGWRHKQLALPKYVYVASSWRNPMHAGVCATLRAAGIEHYDFKNPPGGTGFSWSEVKTETPSVEHWCASCSKPIVLSSFLGMGKWEPDVDANHDPVVWRHVSTGYSACLTGHGGKASPAPVKPKGSDWEAAEEYLRMVAHPRAEEGFTADYDAMKRADTFVMVLPCGKSAHLELGWAVGHGKRTAILLEDPVEPELMYKMADFMTTSLLDLLGWMGVRD